MFAMSLRRRRRRGIYIYIPGVSRNHSSRPIVIAIYQHSGPPGYGAKDSSVALLG